MKKNWKKWKKRENPVKVQQSIFITKITDIKKKKKKESKARMKK